MPWSFWIALVIVILALLYYVYSLFDFPNQGAPPPPTTIIQNPDYGLFLKTVRAPYTSGLSQADAASFCQTYGGQLANDSQLATAFQGGFNSGMVGWSQKAPVFVTQIATPTCGGKKGVCYYPTGSYTSSSLYGAYCYGKIPPSTEFTDITYSFK